MNISQPHLDRRFANRRGTMIPAIAMAIVVFGAALALVVNSLWKQSAVVELENVTEAAALAAAGSYLNDSLLIADFDPATNIRLAQQRAAEVAFANRVAGQPVVLRLPDPLAATDSLAATDALFSDPGDIAFGQRVFDPELGHTIFALTDIDPNVVEVRAQRTRDNGNPLPFFIAGVTGVATANAAVIAEATFDNRIDHYQPTPQLALPALPLAILANDPSGKRTDTWAVNIEQGQGADEYSFDSVTRQIIARPDGIPEISLTSIPLRGNPLLANVQLLDFRNDLGETAINTQIENGLTATDLADLGGRLPDHADLPLTAMATITTTVQQALETQLGQQKLCLLYRDAVELTVPGWAEVTCQQVVAIRIMRVIATAEETATIIVQPTVLTTPTAVLARFANPTDTANPINTANPTDTANSSNTTAGPFVSGDQLPADYPRQRYVYKVYLNR